MRVGEVFNPGGFPSYTYNPRDHLELEEKLKDYLETGCKLLSLSGPTKSGKTVLCKKVIPDNNGIWISGGDIRTENDFWGIINDNLCLFTDVTLGKIEEESSTRSIENHGELDAVVAKVGSSVLQSQENKVDQSRHQSRADTPRSVALKGLRGQNKPIIVDDFHYISESIQTNLIRSLKNPIFQGQRVVLISVPHRAFDSVNVEKEMVGRIQNMAIPLWNEDELLEISNKGFPLLNIDIEEKANIAMAKHSFGNPQLMQECCQKICKINNIIETTTSKIMIPNIVNNEFFKEIAEASGFKPRYEKIKRGPTPHSDRKQRDFVDGHKGDIYEAILLAMANTGPKMEIRYDEIKAELRLLLVTLPQKGEISQAYTYMQKLSSSIEGKPEILEYDNKSDILYIIDPYFAFYLRSVIRTRKDN